MNVSDGDSAIKHFEYDSKDNLYLTVSKLNRLFNRSTDVLVATDELELVMVNLCRLNVKVVFIVMGDFPHYYHLAMVHSSVIDGYIAISEEIYEKLVQLLPHRKDVIQLAYFPTPDAGRGSVAARSKGVLRAIFVGRLEDSKNPLTLVRIDDLLRSRGIQVEWSIVGEGHLSEVFREQVRDRKNFIFKGILANDDLLQLYANQDVFIMTSSMEGLPVSLIEAMKSGLVPVISDIFGGIREIVSHGENGFLCKWDDESKFADSLAMLFENPDLMRSLSEAGKAKVDAQFNAVENSNRYFRIFDKIPYHEGSRKFDYQSPNRLDRPYIPNFIVRFLRSLKK